MQPLDDNILERWNKLSPLPKPYSTGWYFGFPIIKKLLHPGVKDLVDTLHKFKGSYIGITENEAYLYIDNKPAIKVSQTYIEDIILVLADDVKHYNDMSEYRLIEDRWKQIVSSY